MTITPSPTCSSEAGYTASVTLEEKSIEREVVVEPGLVQVREEDGSYRRLAFTRGGVDSKEVRFFHAGRPRSVQSVGGVGGSVEGTQSEGAVVAPMNGQVVKVPIGLGDSVESGDIVLILEAMKMENEVTAPIAGKLVELSVAPGQTVSPGQPLFQIEAIE